MKATMLLCDFAQVADGKLYIAGGGWTFASAMRGFIALFLGVSWDQANHRITATFSLLDEDGNAVPFGDDQQNQMTIVFEVGRPAGLPRGSDLDLPLAVPLPPVDLTPGAYEWILHVDGKTEAHWRLPFRIVAVQGTGA